MWPAAAATLSVLFLIFSFLPGHSAWSVVLSAIIAGLALATIVGAALHARRQRRAFERRIEAWAREQATHAERLRIARDLHDLASHGLGLITVRAATANLADDAERRTALSDIERLGREATAELRQMLTVLRDTENAAVPLRPADSLGALPRIVDEARAAGLTVLFEPMDLGELPPAIQLTVCAILRETLDNVLRHAGPTTATATVHRTEAEIVIDVRDDGPRTDWTPHRGTGRGLSGLQERIALQDGSLMVGREASGFRVTAILPMAGPA
jgi:two-component system sensor histidine kinase DesK